jgi:hypothetical protein
MNRSQACIRVDQLLDWKAHEMRNGRCPLCRAAALELGEAAGDSVYQARERHGDLGGAARRRGFRFDHEHNCQLADANAKILDLCGRHAIRCETFYETVQIVGKPIRVQLMRRVSDEAE